MRPRTIKYRCADWGRAELFALLRGYIRNGAIDQLQRELEQQYRVPLYLLNSARAGFRIALNECRKHQPQRKTVIVPAYICNSVPQTITQMGLEVVSAPVNAQLNLCPLALRSLLNENCLAVVMAHMYGIPADVRTIRMLTYDAGVFLIDDAAQVTEIRVADQLLGTFGDYGLISFSQAKSIVCGVRGSGGVLLNTTGVPLEVSLGPVSKMSRLPNYWHFWANYVAGGAWKTLDYYVERLKHLLSNEGQNHYPNGKSISEPDAAIALAQFGSLSQRIHQAVQLAEIAKNSFSKFRNIAAIQFQDIPQYVTRFVIQTRLLSPHSLKEKLASIGVEARLVFYNNGSRPYDGEPDSGLLELPWIGLSPAEVSIMIEKIGNLDQVH